MSSPDSHATAQSVSDALNGSDGNGNALPYRLVAMLYDANLLGLFKDYAYPESSNTSASQFDHNTTLAKLLTRTHTHGDGNTYDIWDAVQTLLKWVLVQNVHINDDEINSVNHKSTGS